VRSIAVRTRLPAYLERDGPGLTPHRAHRALSRAHWQIENRLFRVGDGTFAEDACRVRTGFARRAA
jgi:hypothetical protein